MNQRTGADQRAGRAGPKRAVRIAHTSLGATVAASRLPLPRPVTRDWAWGGRTEGRGVRVCLIDSGVDTTHPLLDGEIATYRVATEPADELHVVRDDAGDVAGHGTACAGIIRSLAPRCELTSIRILGDNLRSDGSVLLAALEWAIEQRFGLVNLSLSTRRAEYKERLHDLTNRAYFAGTTVVAAAHNSPLQSYPWHFCSVISVGSHAVAEPEYLELNPVPPVEFFALGVEVTVAWPGGGTSRVSGNSFAAPHVTGLSARILGEHPHFGTAELKHVLAAVADNHVKEPA